MSKEGRHLGRRVFAILSECCNLVTDPKELSEVLHDAAIEAGATPVKDAVIQHSFVPHGITAVSVLEESHVVVETWPELRVVTVNAFTCGSGTKPNKIIEIMTDLFKAERVNQTPLEDVMA